MKYILGSKNIRLSVIGILIITYIVISPTSAGLRVTGSIFEGEVSPGITFNHEMTVTLTGETNSVNITIDVLGMGNTLGGYIQSISQEGDNSPYTARPFISLVATKATLKPNVPKNFTATIKIPQNIGAGGRYAIISFRTLPVREGTVAVATVVNVPILIKIKSPGISQTGAISEISFNQTAYEGDVSYISTNIKNTGNYHYIAFDSVTILDATGKTIFNKSIGSNNVIFPTFSFQFNTPINAELVPGTYTAISKVYLENGTVLDNKTTIFEVKKIYKPPFKDVIISLTPQSQGILESGDGKVKIIFPAGAVLDTTQVTLRAVPQSSLPFAPSGARFAGSGFSVEGLTGLLSKDATITVKYGPDEVEIAGGEVSKFLFARYDRTDGKWVLLKTNVDKNAGTLTVTTNRLSTWAVMVSEGAVPTEAGDGTQTKTDGFTGLIALGALGVLFIANRVRKG